MFQSMPLSALNATFSCCPVLPGLTLPSPDAHFAFLETLSIIQVLFLKQYSKADFTFSLEMDWIWVSRCLALCLSLNDFKNPINRASQITKME